MALGLEKNKEKTIKDIQEYLAKDEKNHPFDDDLLNLKSIAETLSNIISNTKDPFVYSINSPYGTGKTFFLRRLHCLLEQKDCLVVSYNAWESDFYSDPISALISELSTQIDYKKFKNIEEDVSVLTNASLGFSVGLTGNISLNKKQKLSNLYEQHKKRKEKFVEALKDFTQKLSSPLVFIIDELDRCRPDYAIQTLEIIKHFFNIPNITFVIGVDRKQIESTVRVLYGSNIDVCCDEYLRKFIDQDFYLPKSSSTQYIANLCNKHLTSVIEHFCNYEKSFSILEHNYLKKYLDLADHLSDFHPYFSTVYVPTNQETIIAIITYYVDALSEYFVFSLRQQEQFIISLKILFSLLSKDDILLPELACLLTAIKLYDNSMLNNPTKTIFQILLYKQPYNNLSVYPDLAKLFNKSGGNIKRYKINQIEKSTTENESDLNVIKFWHNYIGGHKITNGNKYIKIQEYLNNIGGVYLTKKYLQLTKQLSLLQQTLKNITINENVKSTEKQE